MEKRGRMLTKMALFGKKKKTDDKPAESAEIKQSNSVTDEMKVILEAREEEQQEKEAKALERQQEQEEAYKEQQKVQEQVQDAAKRILDGPIVPAGMNFYMICDEIPMGVQPETEGNIIVRGVVRGTVKAGSEIFVYQGRGEKYRVKIEKIKNDNREYVDELTYENAELEITKGDIPMPTNPDENASRPIKRFAVLSDATGIEDTKDPACRGMAAAGNPRTIAMLCEYGRYGKDPEYFSIVMDSIMTSEFAAPVHIANANNGRTNVAFAGVMTKQEPDIMYLPVFTDIKICRNAQQNAYSKQGFDKLFTISFAQTAAIARDQNRQGFIINPGGPITFTIPKKLIDDMVKTAIFKERFGEGAADNPSLALGGSGNNKLDNFIGNGGPNIQGIQRILIKNPTNTPEFLAIEKAVKTYCGSHAKIAKLLILIAAPESDQSNQKYLCIVDCPEDAFQAEVKGLSAAMKPFMRSIKTVQFQLFSKMEDNETFAKRSKWLYSKLPL